MGKQGEDGIRWCDYTFNPWRGCSKVSGPNGTRVVASEKTWKQPVKWNKLAGRLAYIETVLNDHSDNAQGDPVSRPRVFCASLADVFEDWDCCPTYPDGSAVIQCRDCNCFVQNGSNGHGNCCGKCGSGAVEMVSLDDVRRRLFALIDSTPNLDWLLLTKRPENILKMWPIEFTGTRKAIFPGMSGPLGIPLPTHARKKRNNVWLGTSVENQEEAEKRIPELLKCRDLAPVLFLLDGREWNEFPEVGLGGQLNFLEGGQRQAN